MDKLIYTNKNRKMKEIKTKAEDLLAKMKLLDSDEENDLTLNNIWRKIKSY